MAHTHHNDPRQERTALLYSLLATLGAVGVIAVGWVGMWQAQLRLTPQPLTSASVPLPPKPMLDPVAFARGKKLFLTCTACHGPEGRGIQGLGKDLTSSYFVSSTEDKDLIAFIRKGRDPGDPKNTTKIAMPASGGNPAYTDADLAEVVTYLRGLQNPDRAPAVLPEVTVVMPVPGGEAPKGANAEETAWIASGMKVFNSTCIACHGPGGIGIKGNGKTLAKNEFIAGQTEDGLLAFIKKGRDPGDPKNTTGVAMPPKGGNPALSDDDLLDVIAYLRALQGSTPGAPVSGSAPAAPSAAAPQAAQKGQ